MLATLNEVENETGRKVVTIEYIINNEITEDWSIWQGQELITDLFENRLKIHDKHLADSVEAAASKSRCNRGCPGTPGICAKSLGSMTILDCDN